MKFTRRIFSLLLLTLTFTARIASAQVATPISHLGWTEVGQTAAVATTSGVSYLLYDNSATVGTPVTSVTCVAGTPSTNADCTSSIPPLTVGIHVITLTQQVTVAAGTAESAKSSPLSFTMVIVVTPSGVVLKP